MHPINQAREEGASQYNTGKPCRYGHLASRFVSSRQCVVCAGERKKDWARKNADHVKDYARKFLQDNMVGILARNRIWRKENPDLVRAMKRSEYLRNKETILARNKLYRVNNKEKVAASEKRKAARNPECYRAYKKNYKIRKKKAEGSHTGEDIKAILKAQRGKCAYCRKKVGKKYHVDHIQPLFRGGTNDRRNIQISCARCNQTKHAKDPIVFAQSLGMLL